MTDKLDQKKRYLEWFLKNYPLKKPESAEILKLIMFEDHLLERVHFVENVRQIPSALLVSAQGAVTVSYLCRINGVYYEDIAEILGVLVNDPPEELYVWLSFDKELICSLCGEEAGRESGFSKEAAPEEGGNDIAGQFDFIKVLENELNRGLKEKEEKKTRLLIEIDQALDKGNREKFIYLSQIYKDLL